MWRGICTPIMTPSPTSDGPFWPRSRGTFVQILLVAQQGGVLALDVVSQDGTKIQADASKRQAVSYQRLLELVPRLEAEVAALFALADQAEQAAIPSGLVVEEEVARR